MGKIDVHHHLYPPFLSKALEEAGGDPSGWVIPSWSLEADAALCKTIGVSTTIFSVTAPGVTFVKDPVQAASLARELNEYCAQLRDSDRSRYGFFATIPDLLDTTRALEEISHALDILEADGVILLTRYGEDNHYLGHPDIRPIWEELNRRSAVVFVHPTHAVDTNLVNPWSPQPMYDYPHETTRTAMDLIMRGNMRDFPKCKIILSHAGGTLPYLIHRMVMVKDTPFASGVDRSKQEMIEDATRFYYDLALSGNPITLAALLSFAKPGHVLIGSDFPNAPVPTITTFNEGIEQYAMDDATRKEVYQGAALKLFPRLQQFF
ncbi:hypothetical protein BJ170DRAFT_608222 [Xylariales sp. AK1849]|nr:hypothetical protein BJ170DRAFT_608222 [Xylariales sp. AK1849]